MREIQKQIDNLDFKMSQRDKEKLFINFILKFDGERLPDSCIDHFNDLANMLSVRDSRKIGGILDNLENKVKKARRINEVMEVKNLPVITVDIILKKQEEAYFNTQVTFYEERARRVYQGGSRGASIRMAKGISFRVGSNKGDSVSEDYLKEIDTGEFILSNKRIIFVGGSKSWNISLAKLMRVQEVTMNGSPALSLSTETASKKKIVAFSTEDESIEAKAILDRVARGNEKVTETKENAESEEGMLVSVNDEMEDEVLD